MSPRFRSFSGRQAGSGSRDDVAATISEDLGDPGAYRDISASISPGKQRTTEKVLRRALESSVTAQTGPARAYVRKLRAANPEASPAEIARMIDKHFLAAVGSAGTAAGATAAVPGIGTIVAFGAVTADALAFLEAVTFHTIATAIVHGVDIAKVEQREVLVSIVVLGASGNEIVARATKGRKKGSVAKSATQLPDISRLNNVMVTRLAKKYLLSRFKGSLTKFLPAGIGAVLGGWGNVRAGKKMLGQSHEVFGTAPQQWPQTPELVAMAAETETKRAKSK